MVDISKIEEYINKKEKEFIILKNERKNLLGKIDLLQQNLSDIQEFLELKKETEEFLRKMSKTLREETIKRLEVIITNALQHVLQEDISFKIDMPTDKPEAYFSVINNYDGVIVQNEPEDSRGGGIIDTISVALRLALAELFQIKGPLILDEPAKQLSEEYIDNFASFLRMISSEFNRQIIMITHNTTLAECGDVVYNVDKKNGISIVNKVTN